MKEIWAWLGRTLLQSTKISRLVFLIFIFFSQIVAVQRSTQKSTLLSHLINLFLFAVFFLFQRRSMRLCESTTWKACCGAWRTITGAASPGGGFTPSITARWWATWWIWWVFKDTEFYVFWRPSCQELIVSSFLFPTNRCFWMSLQHV